MHVHGLFLALPLHLIAHLLVKLIAMVIEKCAEVVLFLVDLEDGEPALQGLLVVVDALQLPQGFAAVLLVLSSLDAFTCPTRKEFLALLLEWLGLARKVHLLLGDVPDHFIYGVDKNYTSLELIRDGIVGLGGLGDLFLGGSGKRFLFD